MGKIRNAIDKINLGPKFEWIKQFIRFSIMGTVNTIVDLGTYFFCLRVFGWHYQLCNLMAFLASTVNAYVWSHMFVFGDGKAQTLFMHVMRFLKTCATYGLTTVLGFGILWLFVEKLMLSEELAKVLMILILIPLNYLIIRFWAFAKKK